MGLAAYEIVGSAGAGVTYLCLLFNCGPTAKDA